MWVRQHKRGNDEIRFIDISKFVEINAVNGMIYATLPPTENGGDRHTIADFTPTPSECSVTPTPEREAAFKQAFADAKLSCVNLMVAWRKHRNALYLEPDGTDWVTPTHATIGGE